MGLKCKITYINNIPVATNEAGNPSLLYRDALAYTGNATEALNIWATVSTPEYQSIFGKPESVDDVSLEQVVKFYNASKKLDAKLTSQELFGIKQMMRSNGVSTLSEMTKLLKTVFQLGDVPSYNPNLAVATGLFLPEDLPSLDLAAISDLIVRMEGEILRNDFEIAVDQSTINYKNSGVKNILGASEPISIEQIDAEVLDLIADPQSEASFYDRLRELPYTDFVERFYSDKAFATEYMNRFADVVKIPVVEERNGELVADVTNTFSTVKNTMLDGLDSLDIDTNIAYLESIPDTIWEQKLGNIKNIIVEIETELATKNIDIAGLNRISTDKTTILALLQATSTMVLNPSDVNIEVFSQIYDSTFLKTPTTSVQRLDKNLQGLTVIKMHSSKTAQQLFDQHGLIAVGDNLYQKVVQDENVGNLYEYLYQQMQDGNFKLPYQFSLEKDIANKPAVLKDIEKYVNSRDTGLGFYNEKVSLYQLIFKHPVINRSATAQQDAALLNTLATREDYLRTDFVSDFYNYILQEKLKDSEIYRNTLSKFAITDRDITLIGTPTDLKNIEMVQELMDYFKLSTNQNVKKYILSEMRGTASESLAAINFPDLVPEFTGSKNAVGSFVATSPLTDDFIRIGEDTYQKVKQTSTASIFVKLQKPQSSAYYTTRPVFEGYSQETLDRLSNQDMVSMLKKSAADISNGKEKAGMMSTIVNRLLGRNQEARAMSAVKNEQAFTVNLVEFIRAKGIPVVTDEKLIREKLAELGLDSINQMFDFQDMGVNSSLTIKINGNNVTVIPDVRSRTINTEKAAFASATRMFDKIKTYLQNTAKELYRDDMVTRSGNTITLNIKPDLKTKVEALQQLDAEILRIAEEDKKTYAAEFVEGSRTEEELERGVSEETLRDLGYNFLQTPQGNILGFEFQGTIYMDPNRLNNNTTIHELIHVFQSMLTRQALLGNTLAQSVIAKREEVFGDIAREWEAFHKQGGQPVNMQKTFNALMVGVDGGYNLNSPEGATTVVGLLNTAKKLEKVYGIQEKDWVEAQTAKGLASRVRVKNRILKDKTLTLNKEDKAAIEQATANEERVRDILLRIKYRTGWSRGADGQWRYEIEDKDAKVNLPLLKRNTGFFADEMTLEDVLNHPELYKAYPRLRNVEVVVWNDIDLADAAYSRANNVININIATLPESQIKGKFLHEVQHAIQNLEGFATVGTAEMARMGMAGQIPGLSSEGYDTIEEAAYEGIKSIDQLVEEGKTIAEILSGDYSKYFFGDNPQALLEYYVSENPELRDIFTRSQEASPEVQKDLSNIVVTSLTETLGTKPAFDLYLNNISEVEARNVEARLALTPEERKNSLAQDTEDVDREEQITIENGAGKTVVGDYPLFQFVGEGNKLSFKDTKALEQAKQLEADNKTPEEIYQQTNWLKTNQGTWIREIGDLQVIPFTEKELEEEVDALYSQKESIFALNDLFDTTEIGNRYNFSKTDVVLKFKNGDESKITARAIRKGATQTLIEVNIQGTKDTLRKVLGGENIGDNIIRRRVRSGETIQLGVSQTLESIVNHEFQHILQAEDNTRKQGNSLYAILDFFARKNESAITALGVTNYKDLAKALGDIYGKDDFIGYAETLYRNSIGERQATEVERRMFDKSTLPENFDGAFNVDIQDVIGDQAQFQMIEDLQKTIGLNLKSAAYAPRVGETDAAYHSRILTEVEAYIVAPETAANLARLQEENPSLWSEITKFIKNLTEWLKSQIGLLDYKGDVMSMTQAEYTSALGISVLKDPYSGLSTDMKNIPNLQTADKISNDMMNQSITLDSQLEILSLQTEEDQEAILDKIDNCG